MTSTLTFAARFRGPPDSANGGYTAGVLAQYVSGAADLDSGIPANSELSVKLFIDASATTQAGYQVYLFYP